MATENNNDKTNELLTNWSKWLISVNFLSATGCIVALKSAGEATERIGPVFFAAILSFSLSVICTLFVFLLAKHGLQKTSSPSPAAYIWLAKLQWVLFAIGLLFVLLWIGFIARV